MTTLEKCPPQIINYIKIWIVNYFIGLMLVSFYWNDFYKSYGSASSLLVNQVFVAVFISWIFFKIYQGKNWARFTWLFATCLGLFFTLDPIFNTTKIPTASKIHSLFSFILSALICYIIFISPSRFWFSKKSNHITQFSVSKFEHYTQHNSTIEEQHWANALEEFSGSSRKQGLYAQCFSYANGDENIAKAEYLKRRALELFISHKAHIPTNNEIYPDKETHTEKNTLMDIIYRFYFFCTNPINAAFLLVISIGIILFATA